MASKRKKPPDVYGPPVVIKGSPMLSIKGTPILVVRPKRDALVDVVRKIKTKANKAPQK